MPHATPARLREPFEPRLAGSGLGLLAAALVGVACTAEPDSRSNAGPVHPEPAPATSEPVDPGWLARAQRHIAEREYWASENGHGLQAPNRRHGLRAYFEPGGVRIVDRTDPASPTLAQLRLAALGRGDAPPVVPEGEVTHEENRVEIARPGVREWFVNSDAGLEQGFRLDARPPGEGPLVLEVDVSPATARLDGDEVALETPTGRPLSYGKLVVEDATGAVVVARLGVPKSSHLRLVVEDASAAYPLVIDPLLTGTDNGEMESDQQDSAFGITVAGAGDINGDGFGDVIVGAPAYDGGNALQGAAFIFHGSSTGIGNKNPTTATTQLDGTQTSQRFGTSVAGAGDVDGDGLDDVIVGAPNYAHSPTGDGGAFVFHGNAAGIMDGSIADADTTLWGPNNIVSWFGGSVAGAGDVNGDGYQDVIVGNRTFDEACIFHGGSGGVADSDSASADACVSEGLLGSSNFGWQVAGAGDVDADGYDDIVVVALSYSSNGAAFVFHGGAMGITTQTIATANAQIDGIWPSVESASGAGDVNGDGYADIIVGGELAITGESGAFIFHGGPSGVTSGDLTTADTEIEASQGFGYSVAGAGDVNGDGFADVVVGAPFWDGGQVEEGAVFIFLGRSGGIPDGDETGAIARLEQNQAGALLGSSVAAAGDVNGDGFSDVIAGAPEYDSPTADEGSAFVYHGGALGLTDGDPTTAAAGIVSTQLRSNLGNSVAGAGDVNGDGYDDIIVGARRYDAGQNDEGAAFIFHGGSSGIAGGNPAIVADTQLESNQSGANFGESVAGAGDVNGDGFADVIVGAVRYDAGQSDEGAAFVFHGASGGIPDGNPSTAGAFLQSDQADANFGNSVAGAGDVNGDGYADVIVGAYLYDSGETDEGAAFVFHGTPAGIFGSYAWQAPAKLESNQADARLGTSVAGAGDVNGDGYADVIVGAPLYDISGFSDYGAAYIFHGGGVAGVGHGWPAIADTELESHQSGAHFGEGVGAAGDVNGDGFGDVIVGAPLFDNGQTDEGAAFVFHGASGGILDKTSLFANGRLESNSAGAGLGNSVAGAGDVNGDGYADVIAGADTYSNGETFEGGAWVWTGGPGGFGLISTAFAHAAFESNQAQASFGRSVAGAGDVNGDGFADVVIGATNWDAPTDNEGAAFVFLGNDGMTGRPVLTSQLQWNSVLVRVPPWGASDSIFPGRFRQSITATHPEGRGRVKIELEACPPGVPFGNLACVSGFSSSWAQVSPPSATNEIFTSLISLTEGELYRWRARVLHAPTHVTAGGITPPPNPAHGPWRRVSAQSREADIRTVPEPGACLGLISGLAALALLRRRRRSGGGA